MIEMRQPTLHSQANVLMFVTMIHRCLISSTTWVRCYFFFSLCGKNYKCDEIGVNKKIVIIFKLKALRIYKIRRKFEKLSVLLVYCTSVACLRAIINKKPTKKSEQRRDSKRWFVGNDSKCHRTIYVFTWMLVGLSNSQLTQSHTHTHMYATIFNHIRPSMRIHVLDNCIIRCVLSWRLTTT